MKYSIPGENFFHWSVYQGSLAVKWEVGDVGRQL